MEIYAAKRLGFFQKRRKAANQLKRFSEKTLRKIAADYTDPRQKKAQRLLKRKFPTSNDINDVVTGAMFGVAVPGLIEQGWNMIFGTLGFRESFNLLVNAGMSIVAAWRFLRSLKAKHLNKQNPERIKYKNRW